MPAWEYKTIERRSDQPLTEEQLNKVGALGLELVTVLAISEEATVIGRQVQRTTLYYFFKRPKKEA